MRGLFVTGTGTGVGKTVLSAALLAAMRAAGEPVRAYKPVLTGVAEQPPGAWPHDHELLALAADMRPEQVAPLRYGPPTSPYLAAELCGEHIDPAVLLERARALAREGTLVVEGVGGLLVPLSDTYTVADLAAQLALPVIVAAHPGLGTINHTLLTLRAARAAGLVAAAVVLTPWPPSPSVIERSNREVIAGVGAIEVCTLGRLAGPDLGELARAGAALPWRRWLEGESKSTVAGGLHDGPGDRGEIL
jgi:dethiobiotin synthetase